MENQHPTPEPENIAPNTKGSAFPFNKKIDKLLSKIDDGNFFKTLIVLMFRLLAFGFLLGGLFFSVYSIFGQSGYFCGPFCGLDSITMKITAVLGFVIGLIVSLGAIYFIFMVIMKRVKQLKDKEYNGLLEYIYKHTIPTCIIISGEVIASILFTIGILGLFAALLGSLVYFPLGGVLSPFLNDIGVAYSGGYITLEGDWDYIGVYSGIYLSLIMMSLYYLILAYVAKEVYQYACKLVIIFIKFLPKLAIPLAIRKRNE